MSTRQEIVGSFYSEVCEDRRLVKSRHGQLEYAVTMEYIHKFAEKGTKVLELGAGTGRYSIALAKEGMDVTAVELVESNLAVLLENGRGVAGLRAEQGDATDLSRFADDTFDVTLVFGPMYHLYEKDEIRKAIDEAIRVTKPKGVLLFALSRSMVSCMQTTCRETGPPARRKTSTRTIRSGILRSSFLPAMTYRSLSSFLRRNPFCGLPRRASTGCWRLSRRGRIFRSAMRTLRHSSDGILPFARSGNFSE